MKSVIKVLFSVAILVFFTQATLAQVQTKLLAADGERGDRFGKSVDISGDRIWIGATGDNDAGFGAGSVYAYEFVGSTWVQTAKLHASNSGTIRNFGQSVSLWGDYGIVGQFEAATIFKREASDSWVEQVKLLPQAGTSSFGQSVAIWEDRAIVGDWQDGGQGTSSGAVYIYERQDNDSWQQVAKVWASDAEAGDEFGGSVAIYGDIAVVGASQKEDFGYGSGAAYVLERREDGSWLETAKLLPGDTHDREADFFGESVAIYGETALIGSHRADPDLMRSGAAYVFAKTQDGSWTERQMLLASDRAAGDHFGQSVALHEHRALIGANYDSFNGNGSGSAYVYEYQDSGVWEEEAIIRPDDGEEQDRFGIALSVSSTFELIGVPEDDDRASSAGSAYMFNVQSPIPQVFSFSLIDAEANAPVPEFNPIRDGAQLDLNRLPRRLNIRANVLGNIGSVQFDYRDRDNFRLENAPPYALFGDARGDYKGRALPLGESTLSATPFSRRGASGEEGGSFGITFDVIRETVFGPPRTIASDILFTRGVIVSDIDGDGDPDVAAASPVASKIAWYENLNGEGTFRDEHIIDAHMEMASELFAADLDGDGDKDILAATDGYAGYGTPGVFWYENQDGQGAYGSKQLITESIEAIVQLHAIDLDDDGDYDAMSVSFLDGKVAWYENENALGVFGEQQFVSNDLFGASAMDVADFDRDGDQDVVAFFDSPSSIIWYENDDARFIQRQVLSEGDGGEMLAADLDGDGDQDIVTSHYQVTGLGWHENTDGLGTFSEYKTLKEEALRLRVRKIVDLDADGDLDILASSWEERMVVWYEHLDGAGTFSDRQVLLSWERYMPGIEAADLNGDGLVDIIAIEDRDNRIIWYENRMKVRPSPITSFSLMNAATNIPVPNFDPITPGAMLNLERLTEGLNVRANVLDYIKSVRFDLQPDGYARLENAPPFALFGDDGGNYAAGTFLTGDRFITATPYRTVGGGRPDIIKEIRFSVSGTTAGKMTAAVGYSEEAYSKIMPSSESVVHPERFLLEDNFPNPFNPATTIRFGLPESVPVKLLVFDVTGRIVEVLADGKLPAGWHQFEFGGAQLASGVYMYRLQTPEHTFTKKMLLLK